MSKSALVRLAFILITSALLAGCAGVAGAGPGGVAALFVILLLALAACTPSVSEEPVLEEDTSSNSTDAKDTSVPDGRFEPCCVDGKIDSCFCPSNGPSCNYGWYDDCGHGTCVPTVGGCPDVLDGDVTDAQDTSSDTADVQGNWEPCCNNGMIDTCFCEAGWECNYGWFDSCGNGTCAAPGGCDLADVSDAADTADSSETTGPVCPAPETPPPDEPGTWQPCCINYRVDSCFCPEGAICNFGFFEVCDAPADTCVPAGSPQECDGYWENCCNNGCVDVCYCPGGFACNYGWYTDCGEGSCTFEFDNPQSCPGG